MPTLQVRELPDDLYNQLSYLAQKEHRSLAQQTIALLEEGIEARLKGQQRRRKLLETQNPLGIDARNLPDPVTWVRADRER